MSDLRCPTIHSFVTQGKATFGRLGIGQVSSMSAASAAAAVVRTPTLVEDLGGMHVKQITCGFAHTAAVTDTGQVWAWGAGDNGRLGVRAPHLSHLHLIALCVTTRATQQSILMCPCVLAKNGIICVIPSLVVLLFWSQSKEM
jgi:alpha-tubulin suppressor-like RCC1 family protein